MFRGDKINVTENRAVLHVALRAPRGASIVVDGENVVPEVHAVLDTMADFANRVRSGAWNGHTGKRIRNVVNIGIGGSDLGPVMAYEALQHYSDRALTFRFVSNVDGTDFAEATRDLDPAETLFIVSSKTFTTLETMTNAAHGARLVARGPRRRRRPSPSTSSPSRPTRQEVAKFGIDTANMFGFWDWVGGRYSMDSAIGLSTMLAIGPEHFRAMLAGFHEMDEHFRTAPFERNLPVLHGPARPSGTPISSAPQTVAVLPYEQYLKRFPAYLQQLTMESNGKHVTLDGAPRRLPDRPDLLGRAGHQRPALVLSAHPPGHAADSRATSSPSPSRSTRSAGTTTCCWRTSSRRPRRWPSARRAEEVKAEGTPDWLVPHRVFEGNRPSNTILAERLTPDALGKLVALYEHSVFTQGVDLEHRLVRSVGRRAGQGAGAADRPGARERRPSRRSRTTARRNT